MQVRKIVGGEAVFVGEAIQVGHGGICDYVSVVGIFLNDDEDMAELRVGLAGSRSRRRNVGSLAATARAAEYDNRC